MNVKKNNMHKLLPNSIISSIDDLLLCVKNKTPKNIYNGKIKVIFLEYFTKHDELNYVYESHRNVYDLHIILSGTEWVSILPVEKAEEKEAYNDLLDYTLYNSSEIYPEKMIAGDMILFPPEQLHLSGYFHKENKVNKVVLKIPFELLIGID